MSPEFSEIVISLFLISSYTAVFMTPLLSLVWLVVSFQIIIFKRRSPYVLYWQIVAYLILIQLILVDGVFFYNILATSDINGSFSEVGQPISLAICGTLAIVLFWISLRNAKRNNFEVGSVTLSAILQLGVLLLLAWVILLLA